MFTDFVRECASGKDASTMLAGDVKISADDAAAVAAPQQPAA